MKSIVFEQLRKKYYTLLDRENETECKYLIKNSRIYKNLLLKNYTWRTICNEMDVDRSQFRYQLSKPLVSRAI